MADLNYSDLLPALRFNLRENDCGNDCGCMVFSESELLTLLEKHGGDVRAASYEGLVIKAENDSIKLPDGLDVSSAREYWLGLARMYRPCAAHNLPRADEVSDNERHQ